MVISLIIINVIVSLVFAAMLTAIIGRPEAKSKGLGFLFYFILLVLVNWVAALWVTPFGPMVYGASILPILSVALTTSLIIAVAAVAPIKRESINRANIGGESKAVVAAFGVFFWITVIVLIAMILGGYVLIA